MDAAKVLFLVKSCTNIGIWRDREPVELEIKFEKEEGKGEVSGSGLLATLGFRVFWLVACRSLFEQTWQRARGPNVRNQRDS